MKTWWVKVLIGLGVLVIFLWLSFLGSGVRSKNVVERYKDQLQAAGEKLELEEVLPPASIELNGVPLFNEASRHFSSSFDVLGSNPFQAMRMVLPAKAMIGWRQRHVWDGSESNSWDEIGIALGSHARAVALLQGIPEGAKLDFQLDYNAGHRLLLPHLSHLKRSAQLLSAAVVYELHRGDSLAATTNLHALLTLVHGSDDERLLVSQLVRMAVSGIACGATWEILQSGDMSDRDLAWLQAKWSRLRFVQPMESALVVERAYAPLTIRWLREASSPTEALWGGMGSGSTPPGSVGWFDNFKELGDSAKRRTAETVWRASWSFDDELRMLQGAQVLITTVRHVQTNGSFHSALEERDRELKALGLDELPDSWLRTTLSDEIGEVLNFATGFARSLDRVLAAEVARTVVVAAIALKRHHLRNESFPDGLAALVPEFLSSVPKDPVDGQPLRYRLNPDGTFLLYSIGEDGKDDGGNPTPSGSSKSLYWAKGQDWVWPQPATEQEIEAYRITEAGKN
jgi:hypothetical protein